MRFLVTLVLTVVRSGCVNIVEPAGDEPFELVASEWNGTWCLAEEFMPTADDGISLNPADCIVFTVVDAAGGILDMTFLDERTDQMRVHARSARGSGAIVSAETRAGYELVGRARRKGSLVIVWPAKDGGFEDEVEDWRFFEWDEPLILLRLSSSAGPRQLP